MADILDMSCLSPYLKTNWCYFCNFLSGGITPVLKEQLMISDSCVYLAMLSYCHNLTCCWKAIFSMKINFAGLRPCRDADTNLFQ